MGLLYHVLPGSGMFESQAGPGTVLALSLGSVAAKETSSLWPTTSFSKDGLS